MSGRSRRRRGLRRDLGRSNFMLCRRWRVGRRSRRGRDGALGRSRGRGRVLSRSRGHGRVLRRSRGHHRVLMRSRVRAARGWRGRWRRLRGRRRGCSAGGAARLWPGRRDCRRQDRRHEHEAERSQNFGQRVGRWLVGRRRGRQRLGWLVGIGRGRGSGDLRCGWQRRSRGRGRNDAGQGLQRRLQLGKEVSAPVAGDRKSRIGDGSSRRGGRDTSNRRTRSSRWQRGQRSDISHLPDPLRLSDR